jgi:hypothetical protein
MSAPDRALHRFVAVALVVAAAGCAGVQEIGTDPGSPEAATDALDDAPEPVELPDWAPFPGPEADDAPEVITPSPWLETGWEVAADWTGLGGQAFDDLLVVGTGGHALVFDGAGFLPVDTGTTVDLAAADVRDGRRVAVGAGGACLESRGGTFAPLDLGTAADLHGVRLLPTGDLYAVGEHGTIRRWTGEAALNEGSNTDNRLTAVWGPDPAELYVTGGAGGVLEKMGGQWIRTQVAPGADTLHDLDGLVDGPIVAVGDDGVLRRRDALGWREELSNDLDGHALRGVRVDASDDAWAAGDGGTLLRFGLSAEGKGSWSKVPLDGPVFADADLADVFATEVEGVVHGVAVGRGGALLVQQGQGWRDASPVPQGSLHGAVAAPAGAAWAQGATAVAVGTHGLVVRVQGAHLAGLPTGLADDLTAVAALPDGTLRLAGAGRLLRFDPATGALDATSLTPADAVVRAFAGDLAVGDLGLIMRVAADGTTTRLAWDRVYDLHAAVAADDGVAWIAGDHGTLLRVKGDDVAAVPLDLTDDLRALARADDGTLLAAGDHGLVLTLSPAGAVLTTRLDAAAFWYAAAWHPATGWWLAGFQGAVAHRAPGGAWERVDLPRPLPVAALVLDADGAPTALASPATAFRWADAAR